MIRAHFGTTNDDNSRRRHIRELRHVGIHKLPLFWARYQSLLSKILAAIKKISRDCDCVAFKSSFFGSRSGFGSVSRKDLASAEGSCLVVRWTRRWTWWRLTVLLHGGVFTGRLSSCRSGFIGGDLECLEEAYVRWRVWSLIKLLNLWVVLRLLSASSIDLEIKRILIAMFAWYFRYRESLSANWVELIRGFPLQK